MKSYADKEPKRAPKITEEQQNTAAVQQKTAGGRPAEGSIAQLQAMVRSSRQAMQLKEMKALMQAGKRQAQSKDTAQLAGPLDEEELQFKSKEAVQKKGPLDEEELQFKAKDTTQLAGPLDEEELQFKSKEAVQKKGPLDEEELQFKKDETVQCKGPLDEEELQFKAEEPVQKQENRTGLPDDLKAGVENLSGMAMDDVRVHYNSSKPAQLNAYAYTQGTEIHVAPGQEKHLPHEAWHVVQQKQGRVQPTMQMAGGVAVNDDKGLEREADGMGAHADCTGGSVSWQLKRAESVSQRVDHGIGLWRNGVTNEMWLQDDKLGMEAMSQECIHRVSPKRKNFESNHSTVQRMKPKGIKALELATGKKAQLPHKRSYTAYSYLNTSGKKKQGPHRISHIATRVMFAVARHHARDLKSLLCTHLILSPGQNNAKLRRGMARSGAQSKTSQWRERKIAYLRRYNELWRNALLGDEQSIEKLFELQALQTYKWAEGTAKKDETAGKGENRTMVNNDMKSLPPLSKGDTTPAGLTIVDTKNIDPEESKDQANRIINMVKVVDDDSLSEASDTSESDSDVEMEQSVRKKKRPPRTYPQRSYR